MTGKDRISDQEEDDALGPTVRGWRAPSMVPGSAPSGASLRHLPERIGPYRVLGQLGEGGMGVVYLAEQTEPVQRRVALKMLRSGLTHRELQVRFEAERQAMARLHHPNVAQLYEAGSTEDGLPYFVMELVDGIPITDYCDRKRLGIRERIELVQAVCEGVQHAHEKGLLHRDLKPSNILVAEENDRAVPKVLDFGIAKAIDQPLVEGTLFTGERVIGTPAYLSPEAVPSAGSGIDIDTRSDVYSLGISRFSTCTRGVLLRLLLGSWLASPVIAQPPRTSCDGMENLTGADMTPQSLTLPMAQLSNDFTLTGAGCATTGGASVDHVTCFVPETSCLLNFDCAYIPAGAATVTVNVYSGACSTSPATCIDSASGLNVAGVASVSVTAGTQYCVVCESSVNATTCSWTSMLMAALDGSLPVDLQEFSISRLDDADGSEPESDIAEAR